MSESDVISDRRASGGAGEGWGWGLRWKVQLVHNLPQGR